MNACNAALSGDPGCHTAYMNGQGGALTLTEFLMDLSKNAPAKTSAEEALDILAEAWTYYTPEPALKLDDKEPELFQYHEAA